MREQNSIIENETSTHIFSVSAAMVGVCLTVIGMFHAIARLSEFSTLGDNLLAFDALIFLCSCVISYLALRSNDKIRRRRFERIADTFFLSGLSLMAIVCILIAYTFV